MSRPTSISRRELRRDLALAAIRGAGGTLSIGDLARVFPGWRVAVDVAVRDLEAAGLVRNVHGTLELVAREDGTA